MTINEEFRLDKCLTVTNKLVNNMNISRRDVSFLSPLTPGTGYAYIIKQDGLYRVKATYSILLNVTVSCSAGCSICTMKDGGSLISQDGLKLDHIRSISQEGRVVCDWVNGIIISENKFVMPNNRIMLQEFSDLYFMEHTVNYDRHPILDDDEESHISEDKENQKDHRDNVWESIKEWGRKWVYHLIIALGSILVITCLICFCPFGKIIKKCCKGSKDKSPIVRYMKEPYSGGYEETVRVQI